jgi:hypothetical protein
MQLILGVYWNKIKIIHFTILFSIELYFLYKMAPKRLDRFVMVRPYYPTAVFFVSSVKKFYFNNKNLKNRIKYLRYNSITYYTILLLNYTLFIYSYINHIYFIYYIFIHINYFLFSGQIEITSKFIIIKL